MSVEKINIFGDDEEKETGVSDQNEDQKEKPQRSPEPELEIIPEKKKDKSVYPQMPEKIPVIKKKKEKELPN